MSVKYINEFYSLFSEYNNIGFIGTKETMRYKLQLKTNRYIPSKYIDFSLKVFKDIGLLKHSVVAAGRGENSIIKIGERVFLGTKKIWSKVELSNEEIQEKLNSLRDVFENYEVETQPFITKEELDNYKVIYNEKYEIASNILGEDTDSLFTYTYLLPYGIWIDNADRNKFIEELNKIKSYNEDYFIKYKRQCEQIRKDYEKAVQERKKKDKELSDRYNSILKNLCEIVESEISSVGKVAAVIGNNPNCILFGEMFIESIQYNEMKNLISVSNEKINLEIEPVSIAVKDKYIVMYNEWSCEEFRIILENVSSEKIEFLQYLIKKRSMLHKELYGYDY